MTRALGGLLVATFAVGCGGAAAGGPAGDPIRPEAKSLPAVVAVEERVPVKQPPPQGPTDCEAIEPNDGPPPKKYADRSIPEGQKLAEQGLTVLVQSEKPDLPDDEVAAKIEQAVAKFFQSLNADPYNVHATYNLAAAYARIGRNQCSLNLLARLSAMRNFPSQKKEIQEKGSRLFGSAGRWKGRPDPDFDRLRDNPKFKEITKDL